MANRATPGNSFCSFVRRVFFPAGLGAAERLVSALPPRVALPSARPTSGAMKSKTGGGASGGGAKKKLSGGVKKKG
jgi:hypothetical protein